MFLLMSCIVAYVISSSQTVAAPQQRYFRHTIDAGSSISKLTPGSKSRTTLVHLPAKVAKPITPSSFNSAKIEEEDDDLGFIDERIIFPRGKVNANVLRKFEKRPNDTFHKFLIYRFGGDNDTHIEKSR